MPCVVLVEYHRPRGPVNQLDPHGGLWYAMVRVPTLRSPKVDVRMNEKNGPIARRISQRDPEEGLTLQTRFGKGEASWINIGSFRSIIWPVHDTPMTFEDHSTPPMLQWVRSWVYSLIEKDLADVTPSNLLRLLQEGEWHSATPRARVPTRTLGQWWKRLIRREH
jgi:hypothetical protein